jgi:hypothetical protein
LLAQVALSAVGVEIASDAVAHASSSYVRENLQYLQGDARALPLPDASRDVVVSFETIEHFAEQQEFLDEVRRVLRPGGLFVVSTPDRDNYSPTGSPVNAYHVKELTGTEFNALLRSRFPNVSSALQRPIFGSVVLPTETDSAASLCFERRGRGHFEASVGLARPQYILAFASDGPTIALPSSVYIETGRLGMINPEESAARLDAAHAEAAAEGAAHTRLRQETDALRERVASLESDLEAYGGKLAEARGEAKGLLAANEMAERACEALRSELLSRRTVEGHPVTAEAQAPTDAAAAAERAAYARLPQETDALRERIALLESDLEASKGNLAEARGEAKGLLVANEMAERACEALRSELLSKRAVEANHVTTSVQLQTDAALQEQVQRLETAIANIQMSHSWRVTAPLRRISRLLYHRP